MPITTNVLSSLQATESKLRSLTQKLSPEDTQARPAPTKWSIAEIVGHLADAELVTSFRLRQILTLPDGTAVPSYDQDAWAVLGSYGSVPVELTLLKFHILREANLTLLRSLSDQQCEKYGEHAERGRETVAGLMDVIVNHDLNHLKQIENIAQNPHLTPVRKDSNDTDNP